MSEPKKSLTTPPENLKEAIDWVLRVSGRDGTLTDKTTELTNAISVRSTATAYSNNFMSEVNDMSSFISRVAAVLQSFIGYEYSGRKEDNYNFRINGNGIIKLGIIIAKRQSQSTNNNVYTSAYRSTSWDFAVGNSNDAKIKAVQCFYIAIEKIFEGLTKLYLKCKNGWKNENLGGTNLNHFMQKNGFEKAHLNPQMNGNKIISQTFQGLSEFTKAYSAAGDNPSLDAFRSQLEQNAMSSPSNYPLTALYILATYVYVQSTSPGTPSFLGYSGTAALAGGAYGFNLGGLGTFEIENSGTGLSTEQFENVKNALNDSSKNGLIAKLADGLQRFIGYDPSAGGSVFTGPNSKITGAGIAPSNLATYRLCDATIAFTIGVLEGFKGHRAINKDKNREKVNTLITKLYAHFGKGHSGLEEVAQEVESQLANSGKQWPYLDGFVNDFRDSFTKNLPIGLPTDAKGLAEKVEAYLKGVFKDSWGSASGVDGRLTALISNLTSQNTYNPSKFNSNEMNGALQTTVPAVQPILDAGKKAFIDVLKMPNYTRMNYDASTVKWTHSDTANVQTCAKIFLGCVPLYYQALTYIYWGCHENGGGWRNLTLAGGALRSYFDSQGLLPLYVDKSKRGAHIADSALGGFSEFTNGMTKASSPSPFTYSTFTKNLQANVRENANNLPSQCPLFALFHGASCYFRYRQIATARSAMNTPQTIREMLYFLAALQFLPQYEAFDGYVTEYFRAVTGNQSSEDHELKLQVADSGSSKTGETLSAADLKSYIASTFHLAPAFIGLIQGPGTPGEPWLHSLFSNSQFNLSIPSSGAALFYALSNYAYALQFQLHFLYQQCNNSYTKACGWNQCRFGQKINESTASQIVPSHICPTGCNNREHNAGKHENFWECQHTGCGSGGQHSPLQAFLTDRLKGFSRGHPSDQSSHLATCSGSLCHVPMGFNPNDLRTAPGGNTQGENICLTLRPLCGGFNTPLRQLSEKLGCLTKRTPRNLGDVFGFMWHLNSQLFKSEKTAEESLAEFFKSLGVSVTGQLSDIPANKMFQDINNNITKIASQLPSNVIETALSLFPGLPFWYNLFMVNPDDSLPAVLFKVKNIPHQAAKEPKYSGRHNDLYSLYNPNCTTSSNQSCGPYLYPLTHSDGATYNPAHASTYLSWVLYLSDDLQSSFQDMLDEFKNIDCKSLGCVGSCNHSANQHGTTTTNCSCPSVVQCGGTLPLLYRHGFRYFNPAVLMGWKISNGWTQDNDLKRKCSQFASQLNNLLQTNSPLDNLITTIDYFLYAIRWEFFSKLSGFWTIYVCIILYTFFFLLDTLRVRSHLHFPSSNRIVPISLLGTGKAPALKKFAELTYFIPYLIGRSRHKIPVDMSVTHLSRSPTAGMFASYTNEVIDSGEIVVCYEKC
ncbi:variant erythrocyte surface antigen-1 family protein [Babesia caballi]|uniref:Variant erythrocyte surface antigen-1 family protein n=1 Tax=Babesia caballi TaxID=5871 RepID=A0AAV4LYV7_BABCB|nr:variant erythrocyte surface antigen-1 family protein [Babesia caballi]